MSPLAAPRRRLAGRRRPQRGFVLMFALVLLAVMMLVGSGTIETAVSEFRVGAAMRDRASTFEGTEAAALQSFSRLRTLIATGGASCDNSAGRYSGGVLPALGSGTPTDSDAASTAFWMRYGVPSTYSISTSLPTGLVNVNATRYLIECLQIDDEGEPASPSTYPLQYYRLTVFGGGNASAEVLLQTTLVTLPK
ncbi:MAG: PilX N-terminal domain-containing pilus assembly protein [Burkholderiales bacterium]|jgi:Tfp pilus assembly protein PilX